MLPDESEAKAIRTPAPAITKAAATKEMVKRHFFISPPRLFLLPLHPQDRKSFAARSVLHDSSLQALVR
jgi:hypothetical protein